MSDGASREARLLLVDDDDTFRKLLAKELGRLGYLVSTAPDGASCLEQISREDCDVVLLDLSLPGMSGIEILKRLRAKDLPLEVIILTGHGTIDTAIQAIRMGAYNYVEKPCTIERLDVNIRQAYERLSLVRRKTILEDGFAPSFVDPGFVGASPPFRKLIEKIKRVAPTDSSVTILGETGVGKEMVAKLLHAHSPRRQKPFVVVDCGAIHENLIQSELFGHEKGAYTGAARQKHGLFEVADKGTLFLDEVGDLSLETQVKLLRTTETGRFRRLGGTREITCDVRTLSATNRDLEKRIEQGQFREDLFYRLSTIQITVPPLRERPEDTTTLLHHYLDLFNSRFAKSLVFSEEALQHLAAYRWPGNVRQLINVIEQAAILSEGPVIEVSDLPPEMQRTTHSAWNPRGSEILPLREVEKQYIEFVLNKMAGHRTKAATALGISERNLYRKLKELEEK